MEKVIYSSFHFRTKWLNMQARSELERAVCGIKGVFTATVSPDSKKHILRKLRKTSYILCARANVTLHGQYDPLEVCDLLTNRGHEVDEKTSYFISNKGIGYISQIKSERGEN